MFMKTYKNKIIKNNKLSDYKKVIENLKNNFASNFKATID